MSKLYEGILGSVNESLKGRDILEGIFDTEIFRELEQKLKPVGTLSPQERDDIAQLLATPDAKPQDFDGTLEAWLLRISIWGKFTITRKDPEDKVNRTLSRQEFLAYMDNQSRNAQRGLWNVEEKELNIIRFHRTFWSLLGKNVTEEMIVTIDLRPDLKSALKKMRRKIGWFY